MLPDSTHPRVLGAKRGASRPSLISRVTANRLKVLGMLHVWEATNYLRSVMLLRVGWTLAANAALGVVLQNLR